MVSFQGLSLALFLASAAGAALVFGVYPFLVTCLGLARRRPAHASARPVPSVSVLVAARNAAELVPAKAENSRALAWPGELEIVFVSDGSTDGTAERMRAAGGGIRVLELTEHLGKAAALNRGAELCRGEILVFSDADALLAPDALRHLVEPFQDERVGGVCGQRVIREESGALGEAQARYIAADSALKRAESTLGSVTSNDGKLYAIRRALFRPIAPGATDDLYTCLSVVEQGRRFVFAPRALAFVRTPSRNPTHELVRRRRIVARSLHGIALKRALLNPLRYGFFSVQLFVNKVCRRLLPLFLALLLLSSLALAPRAEWARWAALAQLGFYALAGGHPLLERVAWQPARALRRAAATAFYFCVGNLGTLLGLVDFLRGRKAVKWDPLKSG